MFSRNLHDVMIRWTVVFVGEFLSFLSQQNRITRPFSMSILHFIIWFFRYSNPRHGQRLVFVLSHKKSNFLQFARLVPICLNCYRVSSPINAIQFRSDEILLLFVISWCDMSWQTVNKLAFPDEFRLSVRPSHWIFEFNWITVIFHDCWEWPERLHQISIKNHPNITLFDNIFQNIRLFAW